jgi:hypothetical protein
VHFGGVDAREIGLLQQFRDLSHQALAQHLALVGRERARGQQVAIRAERLVALLQIEQLHGVGVPPPIIEVAQEAAHLHHVAVRPCAGHRQTIHQRRARHRQEFLALQGIAGVVRVRRDQFDRFRGRGDGGCDHG